MNKICILGMHRSGTSMVARLLNSCGLYLGPPDELMQPVPDDNPEGYWENKKISRLNDQLLQALGASWDHPPALGWALSPLLQAFQPYAEYSLSELETFPVCGWKDPRTSLLLPFWQAVVPDLKYVLCLRHPVEVAASLSSGKVSTRHFTPDRALKLWCDYHEHIMAHLEPQQWIVTHYSSYFYNPKTELRRLVDLLELQADDQTLETAVQTIQSSLKHYHVPEFTIQAIKSLHLYHSIAAHAGPVYQTMQSDAQYQLQLSQRWFSELYGHNPAILDYPATLEKYRREIEQLNQQLAITHDTLKHYEEENFLLKVHIGEAHQTVLQYQERIELVNQELEQAYHETAHQKAKINKLEVDIASLQTQLTIYQAHLNRSIQYVDALEARLKP